MNKKLIGMITSALVIGTASVALANPFSDVPADHWAYDAIDQLAADGVIEGYGDTSYRGDNEITRYEMAQIVARAMANCEGQEGASKATVDKLAAEFSDELDALGVRVTKLENKVAGLKNITPYGDMRFRYNIKDGYGSNSSKLMHRVRLGFKGDVNDDISFNIRYMIQNHGVMGENESINELADASLTYKNLFKNTNLTFGRYSQNLGMSMYLLNSIGSVDGAVLTHKTRKFDIDLGYADFGYAAEGFNGDPTKKADADRAFYIDAFYKPTADWKFNAMYFNMDNEGTKVTTGDKAETYGVAAEWNFAKNLYLMGEYAKNDENDAQGSVVRLRYNNVSAAKPGSYMVLLERNDWDDNILGSYNLSRSHGECMGKSIGETNWQIEFDMALAKNVVWQNYWAFDRELQNGKSQGDFIRTQVNFSF